MRFKPSLVRRFLPGTSKMRITWSQVLPSPRNTFSSDRVTFISRDQAGDYVDQSSQSHRANASELRHFNTQRPQTDEMKTEKKDTVLNDETSAIERDMCAFGPIGGGEVFNRGSPSSYQIALTRAQRSRGTAAFKFSDRSIHQGPRPLAKTHVLLMY